MLSLVHVEIEDFLFDDLWVFTVERIAFVEDKVDAATKCPDVDLFTKTILF